MNKKQLPGYARKMAMKAAGAPQIKKTSSVEKRLGYKPAIKPLGKAVSKAFPLKKAIRTERAMTNAKAESAKKDSQDSKFYNQY